MRKIKSMSDGDYKKEHGYSRVGGLLKSKKTKQTIERKNKNERKFTPEQNKAAAETMMRNVTVPKKEDLNLPGLYKGDQQHKLAKKKKVPRGGEPKPVYMEATKKRRIFRTKFGPPKED